MHTESMPNFLIKRASLTPDRTALYFNEQAISFKQLYDQAYETAGKLQSNGVNREKYVGVLLKNHLDTVVILFALQLLRIPAVILNSRLTPKEIAWQLQDAKASFLIVEEGTSEIEKEAGIPVLTKENIFSSSISQAEIQSEINLADVCTVMYTSGTTGNPKGVVQTYGNHWWSATASALNLGVSETDRWLCSVPLFHISGYSILMRSVIYGMPMILHEGFNPDKVIEDIRNKHVTIMSIVGTMLARVVDKLEDHRLPDHFRCMLLGGGPAPLPLLESCLEKNIPVFQTCGMTETASQIVTLSPEYSISKLGSAGKPLFPVQLNIIKEDGGTAGPLEAGEIVVKGPNVTPGYLFRPEATKEKFKHNWFSTGDIGYLDADGFLYVLDRRSDLIISGGENIYPAEIESVLLAHPAVLDAGVTAIEDSTWGQVPAAFLVLKKDMSVTSEEVTGFCLERLAKYKIPKQMHFVDTLPRNAAKKLLRRKLSDLLYEGKEKG